MEEFSEKVHQSESFPKQEEIEEIESDDNEIKFQDKDIIIIDDDDF